VYYGLQISVAKVVLPNGDELEGHFSGHRMQPIGTGHAREERCVPEDCDCKC
jgi:hypothetical protein